MQTELAFIEKALRESGALVMASFGPHIATKQKTEKSQLVTDLDLASEKLLVAAIQKAYPHSSIVAEESGFIQKNSEDTWIIDPIDGTSNFASGLPWFGIMVAHVISGEVVTSGIYLPVTQEMYVAESGKGAFKNGIQFSTIKQNDLSLCLIGFGTDGSEKSFDFSTKGALYAALLPHVLNIRSTNSAVDYVYAAEGKLAGLINLENRIWDIAPILAIAKESGCIVTDVQGMEISLVVTEESIAGNFTLLLAPPAIHSQMLQILKART